MGWVFTHPNHPRAVRLELTTLKLINEISSSLFDLANRFSGGNKRRRLGALMSDFGGLLEEIVLNLSEGTHPHAACARMIQLVDHFEITLDDAMDMDVLSLVRIPKLLQAARSMEKLQDELATLPMEDREHALRDLGEIATKLRSVGGSISST